MQKSLTKKRKEKVSCWLFLKLRKYFIKNANFHCPKWLNIVAFDLTRKKKGARHCLLSLYIFLSILGEDRSKFDSNTYMSH